MNKTYLEQEIYKKVGESMKDYQDALDLSRDSFLQKMDDCKLRHKKDKDFFSIAFETLKGYENGVRECPVSKFFIIAILLNMDLNELKKKIQNVYKIEPITK